jgi:hypothetical protein
MVARFSVVPAAEPLPLAASAHSHDPLATRLAADLLALAHRAAYQTVADCALENQQRRRTADEQAASIRATAEQTAAETIEWAVAENDRQLREVQRRAEALLRVVQAQLQSLGLGDDLVQPLFDPPLTGNGLEAAGLGHGPAHDRA